ncbi:serine/threonine-protein kinase [Streptomyces sp. NBC_00038]|uniref:serine/threonine-protein kinase n=1 Tax=Streptomyces sp. NBC_00038 TaxID=2903615 RepID=UPI002252D145|nr:serine/threonine protein kinase [Streptomyces sp. NBC_00038]MCX5557708.1 protein kinase [Streptomyces sp. NBC_00038]
MVTGRYRLVESIGQGGMGRVWRAADDMLDRQVAVKEMRIDGLDPEDTRTRRERTLREARATARIDHPNVVRIYDVVDEGERLWIVMELVAGRSLEQIVVEDGPLSTREAARIGLELVVALRQVHAGGVLHRDIKPGNVLVERSGHRVVLTDFGIAAIQDTKALTMAGMLVGSPDYMAPERVSGHPQGPPSDVWSLGATLCAALGGRSPFSRSTTLATLHAVLYEEPELPASVGDLRDILAAILEKEPSTRPGLEELEAELGQLVFPGPEAGRNGPDRDAGPASDPDAGPAAEPAREEPDAAPSSVPPVHVESPTPVLLDAEFMGGVRKPEPESAYEPEPDPAYEPEPEPAHEPEPEDASEPDPVQDAIPVQRTPTRKSSLDFKKPRPEPPPVSTDEAVAESPAEALAVPETRNTSNAFSASNASNASNASTEVPSELRAEVGSTTPSVSRSAEAVTEAQLSSVPARTGMPPGELPGPAVPAGPSDPRRSRRSLWLAAASGVVAAGVAVWLVLAAIGGPPDDNNAGSPTSSATTGPTGSASPTVEGTSRPPSLPPGAHREAGGYAWATPKGWRRDLKTGSEVHYTSPDGKQEIAAKSSLAKGDLMETWQTSEQNARQGQGYRKIRLEETTFRGRPAIVWEYLFTLQGVGWHAQLLGFDADGKSYQVNTWYQPDIEDQALQVYEQVKKSFTVL